MYVSFFPFRRGGIVDTVDIVGCATGGRGSWWRLHARSPRGSPLTAFPARQSSTHGPSAHLQKAPTFRFIRLVAGNIVNSSSSALFQLCHAKSPSWPSSVKISTAGQMPATVFQNGRYESTRPAPHAINRKPIDPVSFFLPFLRSRPSPVRIRSLAAPRRAKQYEQSTGRLSFQF